MSTNTKLLQTYSSETPNSIGKLLVEILYTTATQDDILYKTRTINICQVYKYPYQNIKPNNNMFIII